MPLMGAAAIHLLQVIHGVETARRPLPIHVHIYKNISIKSLRLFHVN